MEQFEPKLAQAMISLIALMRAKLSKCGERGWPLQAAQQGGEAHLNNKEDTWSKVWKRRCRTSQPRRPLQKCAKRG